MTLRHDAARGQDQGCPPRALDTHGNPIATSFPGVAHVRTREHDDGSRYAIVYPSFLQPILSIYKSWPGTMFRDLSPL